MHLFVVLTVLVLSSAIFSGCEKKKPEIEMSMMTEEPILNEANNVMTEGMNASVLPAGRGMAVENGTEMNNTMMMESATETATDATGAFVAPAAKEIQQALQNAGFYKGKVDGDIGPRTKQAIKDFQLQNNLKADGKVGRKTWAKMSSYLTAAQPATELPAATVETNSTQ